LKLQGVSAFVFRIFDRWGNLVFETNEPNFNWQGYFKGEPLKQDVYVFNMQAEGYNRQVVKKMGSIILIRQ
jgi:gliding motility-associated-like protein